MYARTRAVKIIIDRNWLKCDWYHGFIRQICLELATKQFDIDRHLKMTRTEDDKNRCAVSRHIAYHDLPADLLEHLRYKPGDRFFSSLEWFSCLSNSGFSGAPALQLLVASDKQRGKESIHLLCMREDRKRKRLLSLSNYYTILFPAFIGSGKPSAIAIDSIVDTIKNENPAWSEIEFGYLHANDPATCALRAALVSAGYQVDIFHHKWNWHITVGGRTFRDYLTTRPSHVQNTLRRKLRQVTGKYHLRFADICSSDELSTGLADYLDVYERSWKPREVPPEFVPDLIRLCARLGILRLGILYLDESAVAAQFWIKSGRTSYIYKLAHDPEYSAFSVGSLLTAHMFEQAIDVDKVSEIDFGLGDEAYKRDWTEVRRQRIGLQAVNRRTGRGFLLGLRLAVRNAMRTLGLRSFTPVQLNNTETTEPEAGLCGP